MATPVPSINATEEELSRTLAILKSFKKRITESELPEPLADWIVDNLVSWWGTPEAHSTSPATTSAAPDANVEPAADKPTHVQGADAKVAEQKGGK